MSFNQPAVLIFLVPLLLGLLRWKMEGLTRFRQVFYLLLLLALSGPLLFLEREGGSLVVVIDRSNSMPDGSDQRSLESLKLLGEARPGNNRLGVVAFGQEGAIEQLPGIQAPDSFSGRVDRDGSGLSGALSLGLGMIDKEDGGRILVLSDGLWTGDDPAMVAAEAAARGVSIDYRLVQRQTRGDLAIARLEGPEWVETEEGFIIRAVVSAPEAGNMAYRLYRGSQVISEGSRQVRPGRNSLVFRDRSAAPGTMAYRLMVGGFEDDPQPENNTARLLVGVRGSKRVALLTPEGTSSYGALLRASGLRVDMMKPEAFDGSLENLSRYGSVILENVPARSLGQSLMNQIRLWVEESGGGLLMTGGRKSFGPGGYYRSPLEEVLPVSMEMRVEQRKFSMAMCVAMDRSGSMGAPVGGNRTKMDLANLAASEVIKLLTPMDSFSLIAVDTKPHVIIPMSGVNSEAMSREARSVEVGGGGIYIYEALVAAASQLSSSNASIRHLILFADANDSTNEGKFRQLIAAMREDDITVSVVGLGNEANAHGPLLAEIAALGEGQIYFTEDAASLPRIFAEDTFMMARSSFIEMPTSFGLSGGMNLLTQERFDSPPDLGGYNLCYLREGANGAAFSMDEFKAPIVASWERGLGRVLAFTGETSGAFSGELANWNQLSAFHTALVRWTIGRDDQLPGMSMVTQRLGEGGLKVQLHLDPDRSGEPFEAIPALRVLRGRSNETAGEQVPLRWVGPDRLEATVPMTGSETVLSSLEMGDSSAALAPAVLKYSPEFEPDVDGRGLATLKQLAGLTQGRQRTDLTAVWDAMPQKSREISLAPWLLGLAILCLLLEVLERRTSMVSLAMNGLRLKGRGVFARSEKESPIATPSQQVSSRGETGSPKTAQTSAVNQGSPESKAPDATSEGQAGGLGAALNKARDRAAKRTGDR